MDRAHLVPYNTTERERELAVQLGIPMYAADPRFFGFGTKSGCRQIFAEEGVGIRWDSRTWNSVDAMLRPSGRCALRNQRSTKVIASSTRASGLGNAVIDIPDCLLPEILAEPAALAQRLPGDAFELPEMTYGLYIEKVIEAGAVV